MNQLFSNIIGLMKMSMLWGMLLVVFSFSACKESDQETTEAAAQIKIRSIGQKVKVGGAVKGWKPYIKRDWQIKRDDANLILHGVARKQFANLEAFVKEFDRRYPDGSSYRSQFYDKFSNYDDYNQVNAGKYHNKYLKNLKKWGDENPDAGAPAIALAGFEIYLAWYARGAGYADTVTDSGWEKFHSHIERAREILENAPSAAKKDPHYYSLWMTIHLVQGGEFNEVQKVFEAGQNIDPTYVDLYLRMTNYLQPKWHGEGIDDWSKWLETVLKHPKLSKEDKLVLYGYIVRKNLKGRYDEVDASPTVLYQALGVDKERFMRGLAACCRRFSDSSDWPSAYLYHAAKADSEPAIAEAIELMDYKFAAGVVGGEKEFFVLLSTIEEKYPKLAPLQQD